MHHRNIPCSCSSKEHSGISSNTLASSWFSRSRLVCCGTRPHTSHFHVCICTPDLVWRVEEVRQSLPSLAFSFFCFVQVPILIQRIQLVSPSAPLLDLSQEAEHLCHSLSPSPGPPITLPPASSSFIASICCPNLLTCFSCKELNFPHPGLQGPHT